MVTLSNNIKHRKNNVHKKYKNFNIVFVKDALIYYIEKPIMKSIYKFGLSVCLFVSSKRQNG